MLKVRDVMSHSVVTVEPGAPLKRVAELLVENVISGIPVVDAERRVLGVVSEADLLVKEQGPDAIHHRRLARLIGESGSTRAQERKLEARTAIEAMTAPAVTIAPDRPIAQAAEIMTSRRVNRLPVVDDGRLVGIVTRADLVRAYVRSDDELTETIRQDVILRMLWLDPAGFDVRVSNGIARIGGRTRQRTTVEMLERVIAMVPGVVGVIMEVAWDTDDRKAQPQGADLVSPYRAPR